MYRLLVEEPMRKRMRAKRMGWGDRWLGAALALGTEPGKRHHFRPLWPIILFGTLSVQLRQRLQMQMQHSLQP